MKPSKVAPTVRTGSKGGHTRKGASGPSFMTHVTKVCSPMARSTRSHSVSGTSPSQPLRLAADDQSVARLVHEMGGRERVEAAPFLVEDTGMPRGWGSARCQDREGSSSRRVLQRDLMQANRSQVVLDAANRDPVVDGLHVLIQVHLDRRRVIIRDQLP